MLERILRFGKYYVNKGFLLTCLGIFMQKYIKTSRGIVAAE